MNVSSPGKKQGCPCLTLCHQFEILCSLIAEVLIPLGNSFFASISEFHIVGLIDDLNGVAGTLLEIHPRTIFSLELITTPRVFGGIIVLLEPLEIFGEIVFVTSVLRDGFGDSDGRQIMGGYDGVVPGAEVTKVMLANILNHFFFSLLFVFSLGTIIV
jgi:hypothetical protein